MKYMTWASILYQKSLFINIVGNCRKLSMFFEPQWHWRLACMKWDLLLLRIHTSMKLYNAVQRDTLSSLYQVSGYFNLYEKKKENLLLAIILIRQCKRERERECNEKSYYFTLCVPLYSDCMSIKNETVWSSDGTCWVAKKNIAHRIIYIY